VKQNTVRTAPTVAATWRGVTGFVTRHRPHYLPGLPVKSHQPGGLCATDIEQHKAAFDKRRTGSSEEAFANVELLVCIDSPQFFAGCKVEAVQDALSPERVDPPCRNRRRRTRTFVKAEIIAVVRWVVKPPDFLTGRGIETLDGLLVTHAMEQNQFAIRRQPVR
jgi:hypothetical protein